MKQNGMGSKASRNVSFLSRSIKNQTGVTLIEMVIAGAMMAVIAVVVMKVNEQSNTATAKQEVKNDMTTVVNEISTLLSDPKKCKLTFASTAATPPGNATVEATQITTTGIVSKVDDEAAPPTMEASKFENFETSGNMYGVANMKILSYTLANEGPNKNTLIVAFENKKKLKASTSMQGDTIERKINLYVEWDTSDTTPVVKECRSLLSATTLIWSRGSGTDIFYSGGKVGINIANPDKDLHIEGEMFVKDDITAQSFMYSSDARLKKNTETIHNPISKLMKLRGVGFNWKDNNKADYGFIAQEVQKTLPEIVRHHKKIDMYSVDYVKVVPFLLEGIKKQQVEIEKLEEELKRIQN